VLTDCLSAMAVNCTPNNNQQAAYPISVAIVDSIGDGERNI